MDSQGMCSVLIRALPGLAPLSTRGGAEPIVAGLLHPTRARREDTALLPPASVALTNTLHDLRRAPLVVMEVVVEARREAQIIRGP